MRRPGGAGLLLAAVVAAGATRARADEPVVEPTFTYVVRAGDTCNKIGKRVYGDGERYDLIHKYNALGPLPHRLVKGQALRLPVLLPTPDAKLTGAAGPVRARPPETEAWREAARGLPLFRLWRVNSQDRASAEITFRDDSRVYLRENTVVIIYGDTGARARRDTQDAVLERGTLKTRLGELAGEGGFQLETPSAAAGVGRGAVVFEVDDTGATRVSNLEGDAVSVAGKLGALASVGAAAGGAGAGAGAAAAKPPKLKKTRPVAVAPGMGVAVEPGKAPGTPRALPAAPQWTDAADVATVLLGATPVTLSWQPVAVAARYRVELSRDPGGADIESRVEVPADVTSFEAQGLPEGSYWVRVSAVDADRFESAPSSARRLTLGVARALPPRGLAGGADAALAHVVGGTLLAPAGCRCGPADGSAAAAPALLLRSPGPLALRCETAAGAPAGGFELEVAPLAVTLPGPTTLRAGDSATVVVVVPAGLQQDV
ncbi:MAG: FecR domain-containing protein, partial [Deltaproteobacteria bacterium]|nr:FecR domain-containing protein [Deltaproteobacteria bacterium]